MTALVRSLNNPLPQSLRRRRSVLAGNSVRPAYPRSEAIFRHGILLTQSSPRLAGEPWGFAEEVIGWLWTRAPLQAVLLYRIST